MYIFPIVLFLLLVSKAVSAASGPAQGDRVATRPRPEFGFVAFAGTAARVLAVLALLAQIGSDPLWSIVVPGGDDLDAVRIPLQLALLFPGFWSRQVLARLGLVRTTWAWNRVFPPLDKFADVQAAAVIEASRALRSRFARPSDAEWLGGRLPPPHSGWAMVARAELHQVRGDEGRARALYTALKGFSGGYVALHAILWLQADAARQGGWNEVTALGARREAGASSRAFGAVIARIRGGAAPPLPLVLLLFAAASARWALWPWLREAVAAPPRRPVPEPVGDAMQRALTLHAWALAAPAGTVSAATLGRLGQAWDAVERDASLPGTLGRRIAVLDVRRSPEEVRAELLLQAEAGVTALVERGPLPSDTGPGLLERARQSVWQRRAAMVESLCHRALRSDRAPRYADREHSWVLWGQVRDAWEQARAVANPEERRLLFDSCWADACNWAAFLDNVLAEGNLSHEVFLFLITECRAVKATGEVRELLESNVYVTR